jgi:hypothetical protein
MALAGQIIWFAAPQQGVALDLLTVRNASAKVETFPISTDR